MLFGPSGAGKTTTLRSIAGLLRPRRGHIEIGGRVVYDAKAGVWVPSHRRQVGYLTQQYHLFPHLTVAGNIAYGLPRAGRMGQTGRERVQEQIRELVQALHLEGLGGPADLGAVRRPATAGGPGPGPGAESPVVAAG